MFEKEFFAKEYVMKITILLTGATGFIGHHTVEGILKHTPWNVIALDGLNYAGDPYRLQDIESFPKWVQDVRLKLLYHDIRAPLMGNNIVGRIGDVQHIIHMAAETHVDRSIRSE